MVERELHDLGAVLGGLFVRMHEGRRDQLDLLARQLEVVGGQRGRTHRERENGCTEQQIATVHHDIFPLCER